MAAAVEVAEAALEDVEVGGLGGEEVGEREDEVAD